METNIKIPKLNEMELVGNGYYTDYHKGYQKGKKISTRFNLDDAIILFDNSINVLKDPCKYQEGLNNLQIELTQFYTTLESRMIVNLFKRIISHKSSEILNKELISFGVSALNINDHEFWELVIDHTINEEFLTVEYIEYFKYKNSFTYVTVLQHIEFNDEGEEIDKYQEMLLMTDQIKDYWDFDIEKKIHLQKLDVSCVTNVILTFHNRQEIFNLYIPFEKLSDSISFTEFILDTEVGSDQRMNSLRKISTNIIPTDDQIVKMGEAYNDFIDWYLPCNGKFYFNEADN